MSCPVSSRRSGNLLLILLEEVLKGAVDGRVVGGVVLPAAPDDADPGSCEDPDGVGVVVATGAGLLVQLGGPGVDVAGVGSEVAYRVAELLVRTPPEDHRLDLAGLTGRGSNPGQAGKGVRGGEPAPGVADLGQQPGRADGPRPRQAGEDGAVGVCLELRADAVGQGLDLRVQGPQERDQRPSSDRMDTSVRTDSATPLCTALKSVAAAGKTLCRWALSWLPTATRCATRSRRARTLARSVVVAAESKTIGRSRRASVRTTSANT